MNARDAGRVAFAVIGAAITLAALARASTAPLRYHDDDAARLRLSWSARPERIEACRTLSREELEEREEHMRQRVECNGRFATYALRVTIDGRLAVDTVVRGAGLRHDRSAYVLRDIDLPSGVHHVVVSFTRREKADDDAAAFAPVASAAEDTGLFAGRASREAVERARRARAAVPARLVLDTTIALDSLQVAVVTFNHESRVLELLGENAAGLR
jgi:hypothetical protein